MFQIDVLSLSQIFVCMLLELILKLFKLFLEQFDNHSLGPASRQYKLRKVYLVKKKNCNKMVYLFKGQSRSFATFSI